MARPTKEQLELLDQRVRRARSKGLTKQEFERLLTKSAQPIPKPAKQPDSQEDKTSE